MKHLALVVLSAFVLSSVASSAKDSSYETYRRTLSSVPAPELPAKSAELVKKAKSRDWGVTTINVVKAGVSLNPAAAPSIVGAIAKSVPEMASLAASTAAEAQPEQASAIAKAAATAAPAKAGPIVASVVRSVPNQYRSVAVSVSEAAPTANNEILVSVGTAIPQLQSGIQAAVANNSSTPVGPALEQAARGPSPGGPFVPLSGTPQVQTPAQGQPQVAGGRNYSAP